MVCHLISIQFSPLRLTHNSKVKPVCAVLFCEAVLPCGLSQRTTDPDAYPLETQRIIRLV